MAGLYEHTPKSWTGNTLLKVGLSSEFKRT